MPLSFQDAQAFSHVAWHAHRKGVAKIQLTTIRYCLKTIFPFQVSLHTANISMLNVYSIEHAKLSKFVVVVVVVVGFFWLGNILTIQPGL
jgi:hypothetical protein